VIQMFLLGVTFLEIETRDQTTANAVSFISLASSNPCAPLLRVSSPSMGGLCSPDSLAARREAFRFFQRCLLRFSQSAVGVRVLDTNTNPPAVAASLLKCILSSALPNSNVTFLSQPNRKLELGPVRVPPPLSSEYLCSAG